MNRLSRSQSITSSKSLTKESTNDATEPTNYIIRNELEITLPKSKKVNFSIARLTDRVVQESTGSDGKKKYCRLNFSAAANHKGTIGKILYWCKTKIFGEDTKQIQPNINVSGRDNIRLVGAKIFAESLNEDFINTPEPFKENERRLILQGVDASIYIKKTDGNYILTSDQNHRPYESKVLATFSELEVREKCGKFLAVSKDVEAYLKDQQLFGIKIDSIAHKPPVVIEETEAYLQIEESFQTELKNQKDFYTQSYENKLYISISPTKLPPEPGIPEEKFISYKSFQYGGTLNSFRNADTLVNQDVINLVAKIESKNLPPGSEIHIDMLCASTQIGYKLVEKFPNFKFKLFINDIQDMESVSAQIPTATPDNVSQITIMMSGEVKNRSAIKELIVDKMPIHNFKPQSDDTKVRIIIDPFLPHGLSDIPIWQKFDNNLNTNELIAFDMGQKHNRIPKSEISQYSRHMRDVKRYYNQDPVEEGNILYSRPDGQIYGKVENKRLSGYGYYINKLGQIFKGTIVNNANLNGNLYYPDGDRFEGEINPSHGLINGTLYYLIGAKYKGTFNPQDNSFLNGVYSDINGKETIYTDGQEQRITV